MASAKHQGTEQDDEAAPKEPKQKSELVGLVIPGAIAIFLAVLGAQVAAPLLTQMLSAKPNAAEAAADEDYFDEESPPANARRGTPSGPAIYAPLDPPLVVSFAESDGTRFLQLAVQAMARSEPAIQGVKQHAPAIRNAFLFLLSARTVEELMTLEGKEKLRADMTVKAQEILETNTGQPGIEELYFTSFVIQ